MAPYVDRDKRIKQGRRPPLASIRRDYQSGKLLRFHRSAPTADSYQLCGNFLLAVRWFAEIRARQRGKPGETKQAVFHPDRLRRTPTPSQIFDRAARSWLAKLRRVKRKDARLERPRAHGPVVLRECAVSSRALTIAATRRVLTNRKIPIYDTNIYERFM